MDCVNVCNQNLLTIRYIKNKLVLASQEAKPFKEQITRSVVPVLISQEKLTYVEVEQETICHVQNNREIEVKVLTVEVA